MGNSHNNFSYTGSPQVKISQKVLGGLLFLTHTVGPLSAQFYPYSLGLFYWKNFGLGTFLPLSSARLGHFSARFLRLRLRLTGLRMKKLNSIAYYCISTDNSPCIAGQYLHSLSDSCERMIHVNVYPVSVSFNVSVVLTDTDRRSGTRSPIDTTTVNRALTLINTLMLLLLSL